LHWSAAVVSWPASDQGRGTITPGSDDRAARDA
jgi:hypothetical protein